MTTQWAKKESQTNELAEALQGAVVWAERNRAAAIGGAVGVVLAAALAAFVLTRRHRIQEEIWTQFGQTQGYAYAGRPAESLARAQALAEKHPGSLAAGFAQLTAGDILFQQEKYKEAADTYRRVLDSGADKTLAPFALAGWALSQESAGDPKASAESAQRFLDQHPDHALAAPVHACLARSLRLLGQADKAKSALERMSFLYPDTYWAAWAKDRLKS